MITCSCGKVMDKVPAWLSSVSVEFICNNCPNRQVKSITQISGDQIMSPRSEVSDLASVDSFGEEEEEEEAD